MFQRSNKTNKSVTFNQEVADQTLLAVIETELAKHPHKTFSDLCKEALWQFLYVPESVRPSPKTGEMEQQISQLRQQVADLEQRLLPKASGQVQAVDSHLPAPVYGQTEQQIAELQRQFAAFEQRVFAKESGRLETLERQLHQLSQQMMQLALQPNQRPGSEGLSPLEALPEPQPVTPEPPREVDPLLERLGGLLDNDF